MFYVVFHTEYTVLELKPTLRHYRGAMTLYEYQHWSCHYIYVVSPKA